MRLRLLLVLFVGCVALSLGCNGDNSSSPSSVSPNPFAGNWSFTFTGSCSGTGQVRIDSAGGYFSAVGNWPVLGPDCGSVSQGGVNSTGIVAGIIVDFDEYSGSFTGNLNDVSGGGTWETWGGASGTWSASRLLN